MQQLIRRGQTTNEKVVGWNILRDFVSADRTDRESDMTEERLIEKTLRRIDPNPLTFFLDSLKNQVLEVQMLLLNINRSMTWKSVILFRFS